MAAGVTLDGLRVLREVAALGSLTAAAGKLGYTQSAVSRQVAALEAVVGTPLFRRWARGVRPTAAGAVLLRHAATILSAVETAEHEVAGLRDRVAGRVVVGAFPTATAVLLPRAIARVTAAHPALTVVLHEGASPSLVGRVRDGRMEVAVIGVGADLPPYDLDGLRVSVVSSGGLHVAVAAGHRLAHRERVQVEELAAERWIIGEPTNGTDPQFQAWPTLLDPRIGYAVRSWPARLGMVAAGLGISLIPELSAASVPSGVHVIAVDDRDFPGRRTVAITRHNPSDEADAVVQALRTEGSELMGRL